jgi:PrgI family protein
MARYKVIQDIEAEDKLVGPLSLRQFIYAAIAALCAYLSFVSLTKGASFLLVIFVPVMLFTGFFATPWVGNQPTEVWALAKIRFYIKPRRRIWNQSGVRDLVNITAPKHSEKIYTNGLSQGEVRSRLNALANTLDSRGWAVKNVNTNLYDPTSTPLLSESDRLIDPSALPKEVSQVEVLASDDILDESSNPVAQNFDRLVNASSTNHHAQLLKQLKEPSNQTDPVASQLPPPADYWFLNQPLDVSGSGTNKAGVAVAQVVQPQQNNDEFDYQSHSELPDERALAEKLKANRRQLQTANYQHMKVIQPIGQHVVPTNGSTSPPRTDSASVTAHPDPAKMLLASRDDLNIATIGRIANKQDERPQEVVISLHDHAS